MSVSYNSAPLRPKRALGDGPLRVGFIGAGAISQHHAAALRALPGVELASICDADERKAGAFQAKWGVPNRFLHADEMLKAGRHDVIHVLVPPSAHAGCVRTALESPDGCSYVLVEKPAFATAAECADIARLADATGKTVAVNHNARFHPAMLRLYDLIRSCRIGRLQHLNVVVNVPLRQLSDGDHSHWMFRSVLNTLLEQATHPLSQIDYLLGSACSVQIMSCDPAPLNDGKRFSTVWLMSLACQRGTAQCLLSFDKGFMAASITAIGEDAVANLDLRRNTIGIDEKSRFAEPVDSLLSVTKSGAATLGQGLGNFGRTVVSILGWIPPSDPFSSGMRASLAAFYEAVRRGTPPPAGIEEATRLLNVCETMAESVEHRRTTLGNEVESYAVSC